MIFFHGHHSDQELADLSSKLGIPLDAEQNKHGELLEIRDPFNNNFNL